MRSRFGYLPSSGSHPLRVILLVGVLGSLARVSLAQGFVPGDLNDDGFFDVVDSTVLSRALVPLLPGITQPCVALGGDVNADSAFDALDSTVVRQALAGVGPGISQTCAVVVDDDGDGFEPADGDCDDTNPLVNPAAFDFIGNGLDDDCAGGLDTPRVVCDGGLASDASSALSYALAMDLCQTAVESPPPDQLTWGVISAAFTLASDEGTPGPDAHSIRPSFGTNNGTRFGNAMTVLSTGNAAAPGNTNPPHVAFQLGGVGFTSTFVLFESTSVRDWLAANGGVPPSAPGCPAPGDTTQGKDSTMLRLRIRVPTNARSFRLAAKHFNADYPEFVCSPYNDYFLVLLDSAVAGTLANPSDKNLAVVGGLGVGANLVTSGLFQDCLNGATGCAAGAVAASYAGCLATTGLTGTGMDVLDPPAIDGTVGSCGASNMAGGATAWLGIRGNVVPGEVIELRIVLWDTYDPLYDSLVLLDDFRWSATEIQPGTIAD